MSEVLRLCHGLKSGIEGAVELIGSSVNDFVCGFHLGETSRAIHARLSLSDVLSVHSIFHTISNDRAVEEMIAIADRRAA